MADLVAPVHTLVEDKDFWQNQDHGLAIFTGDGVFRVFELPISVPLQQVVSDAFYVTPLLPLLNSDQRFYILSLSENEVRLFDANRYPINEVKVDGMPTSTKEALGVEEKERAR